MSSSVRKRRTASLRWHVQPTVRWKMVPRGGIEPSPIRLTIHDFFDVDLPVYPPVDPALSSGSEGATLCRDTVRCGAPLYARARDGSRGLLSALPLRSGEPLEGTPETVEGLWLRCCRQMHDGILGSANT